MGGQRPASTLIDQIAQYRLKFRLFDQSASPVGNHDFPVFVQEKKVGVLRTPNCDATRSPVSYKTGK